MTHLGEGHKSPSTVLQHVRPVNEKCVRLMKVRLDAVDWKILAALQANGRITNVELARRAGISAPPCLRRVRALEQGGIIKGYRTLIEEKELGYDLTAFAFVGLRNQTEAELVRFEEKLRHWPIVREAWMVSGEVDFILFCITDTLRSFQNFVIETLTAAENVDTVRTSLTIRPSKTLPRVPMEDMAELTQPKERRPLAV